MLAHKHGCMASSARQGISIKDIYDQKLIKKIGFVTTISVQKGTAGRGNVRGGVPMGRCGYFQCVDAD